jgi:hypothetical protein
MSMESYGGSILAGETEELGENPVPMPLCSPQIDVRSVISYVF